jgi:hypothetical protein
VLAELEGALDGSLPEEAALLARNLEIQESRTRRGAAQLEQVEEALARDDVTGALAAAERLSREFGDLPALLEEALDLLEAARSDAPEHFARYEGTLVERLRVVEVEPRVEELLDAGRVSSALDLVAGLRAASPQEEEATARLLRRIDEHARATGEPVQERVRELWEEGRLMVALHMLNDESLEALHGTGIWFELMEMAEDLEDQIDAQVPAELRPIPRRRHLPAGRREESVKDAAPEEGESSGL